jgi:hypothetical protein
MASDGLRSKFYGMGKDIAIIGAFNEVLPQRPSTNLSSPINQKYMSFIPLSKHYMSPPSTSGTEIQKDSLKLKPKYETELPSLNLNELR